jgi:plastocyanin
MPFTWRINIKKNPKPPGPAVFEFDQAPQIEVGDQIFWSNQDSVAHFPTPLDPTFVFMPNQIAANSTSPAFAPGQTGKIDYICSLHKDEKGTIDVVAPAAQTGAQSEDL